MFRADAIEAEPIVNATLDALLAWAPTRGRPGSDLRTVIGDTKAHCRVLLQTDAIGPPLVKCFDTAFTSGVTLPQILKIRATAWEFYPKTVGAIVVQDSLVALCLSIAADIIAKTVFVSRQDVEALRAQMNEVFAEIEEEVADELESMTYRALIKLHAAVVAHMVETARPLPQMLKFRFGFPQPTLVMAYKLYSNAGRADELLRENKVVHPAFTRMAGRALSV